MTESLSYLEIAKQRRKTLFDSKFVRYGKSVQLAIRSASDLPKVLELDEALWAATAAPTNSFECEPALLSHIDGKGVGRIRVAEVKAAVRWLLAHVETDEIRADNVTLSTGSLLTGGADSERIASVAAKLQKRFSAESVSLIQVQRTLAETLDKGPKKAGAVSAEDVAIPEPLGSLNPSDLINDILLAVGEDGATAVAQSDLEQFFIAAEQVQEWRRQGEDIIRPLGSNSAAAVTLYNELKPKIDEYFQLCAATALDPSINDRWQLPAPGSADFAQQLALAPLARPAVSASLTVDSGINPLFAERFVAFMQKAVQPLFDGSERLTAENWRLLEQKLESYRQWYAGRPVVGAHEIPPERLSVWLDEPRYRQQLEEALIASRRAQLDISNLQAAEKLLLFQSQLLNFVNSFVSFPDLYDPNGRALFEMGTLIMDARRFTLAVRLFDRARHVKFSADSNMFVLYVEITNDDEKPLYELAVPVTSGSRGNLQLGKRGVFHDRHGQEFHARVVQLVEKPISLREAIAAPFKALGTAITGKIEGLAESAKDKLLKTGESAVDNVTVASGSLPATAPAPAPAPASQQSGTGFLAGGGIAVAALASSAAFITKTLANLSFLNIATAVLTAAVLVVLPVTLLAWIRLRRRDISSILEGSGWAINARMRLDRSQANTFTARPTAGLLAGQRPNSIRVWQWLTGGVGLVVGALAVALWQGWLPPLASWF